jgi:hypothetical protein
MVSCGLDRGQWRTPVSRVKNAEISLPIWETTRFSQRSLPYDRLVHFRKDPENEVAMLSAPFYQSADLGNGRWSTRALLQGNEGARRRAGSECALLGHLRLTVDWSMSRYAIPVLVGNGHLVPTLGFALMGIRVAVQNTVLWEKKVLFSKL